jgi:MFS transporter, DHA3 family, macrolide efflux protein
VMSDVSLCENAAVTIFGMVGGVLVDRLDRMKIAIWSDVIRATLVAAVPIIGSFGEMHVWHLFLLAVLMGTFGSFFSPALQATLPNLVGAEQFAGFAALMDTPSRFARMIGPGLSGLLLTTVPIVEFFSLDAATFVVSALCMACILLRRVRTQNVRVAKATKNAPDAPRNPRKQSVWIDISMGWSILRANKMLFSIMATDFVGDAAYVAFVLGGLLLVTQKFHAGVGQYGLLIAAYGIGSLVGNFAIGNMNSARIRTLLAVSGYLGVGLGLIGLSRVSHVTAGMISVGISGVFGSVAHVTRTTYVGESVSNEHLGKIYGIDNVLGTVSNMLGTVICGFLLDIFSADMIIGVSGMVMITASSIGLMSVVSQRRRVSAAEAIN